MQDSVFTKIIKGEIPCHKIYEDDRVLAFLDISPLTSGHTLVIPKNQVDHLWDLEDDLYLHVMKITKRVAERQREVLHPQRIGVIVDGFDIPHAHVHVFPMETGLENMVKHKVDKPDAIALAEMAERLKF